MDDPVRSLDQAQVVAALVRWGLLSPAEVVDGQVEVIDVSRRNRNYEVRVAVDAGWLIKQAKTADAAVTVAHEAAVYRHLHQFGQPALRAALPTRCEYDPASGLLAVTLVAYARSAVEHRARTGRFARSAGVALGRALGALHATPLDGDVSWASAPPWVLDVHRPWVNSLREASGAHLSVIRMVQSNPAFGAALDDIAATWAPSALVHNDVKWDNVLIARPPDQRRTTVQLVDWELAGYGDPAWDIGSVFAAYLTTWVRSIPITGAQPPTRWADLAEYPLDDMFPAQSSFWTAYVRTAGLEVDAARRLLSRSMAMLGARLTLSAVEASQLAREVTGDTVLLLQLAFNVLRRPFEASRHLCGIHGIE